MTENKKSDIEVFLNPPGQCPEGMTVLYWCSLDSAPHIGYRNKKAMREALPDKAWVDFGSVGGWPEEMVVGWIYCPTPKLP